MQSGNRPHCSAFDGENVKAAEQFTVAQREWSERVEFNAPPDTIQVISEAEREWNV